jgi:hypothetical protein
MIKPCPFCGSKPLVLGRKMPDKSYVIGCSNPECIIYLPDDVVETELHNYGWVWENKKDMLNAWNRRASW